jgi:ankyrin repeat protein
LLQRTAVETIRFNRAALQRPLSKALVAYMHMSSLLNRIEAGRTDHVLDLVSSEGCAGVIREAGVGLLKSIAYYGDVSALRILQTKGLSLDALGPDMGLNAAAFHGHWQLCEYLVSCGASPNYAEVATGETPLHSALTNENRERYDLVIKVLLAAGADPRARTKPWVPTDSFMREARTRGELPLHRAALFGTPETISLLLDAGADPEDTDAMGESALAWASWARRPVEVLRALLHGEHQIHPEYKLLRVRLLGEPGAT